MRSLECIVWCPACGEEHYRIYRESDPSNEAVFHNNPDPWPPDGVIPTHCPCGGLLERKPL